MIFPSAALFQFTPLREGRRVLESGHFGVVKISIHAPPRGATAQEAQEEAAAYNFNSRPSARGDRTLIS